MSFRGSGRGRGRGIVKVIDDTDEPTSSQEFTEAETASSLSGSCEIRSVFKQPQEASSSTEKPPSERLCHGNPPTVMSNAPRGNLFSGVSSEFFAMRLNSTPSGRSTVRSPLLSPMADIQKPKLATHGTSGDPMYLIANYVKIFLKGFQDLFQYHVKFTPDVENKKFRREIISQHKTILKDVAFDGTTIFSFHDLGALVELVGSLPTTSEDIQISLKKVARNSMDSPEFFHIANLIFRKLLGLCGLKLIGRNYYQFDRKMDVDRYKLTIFRGFLSNVNFYDGSLMINVDLAHKVLNRTTVYESLQDIFNRYQNVNEAQNMANKEITGQVVLTTYNSLTYTVSNIAWSCSPSDIFTMGDGSKSSFIQYYKDKYNIEIKDPHQPLLVSSLPKSDRGKKKKKKVLLIPEICCVTGITDTMRFDTDCMKELSNYSQVSTSTRYECLRNLLNDIHHNKQCKDELAKWNLELDTDMVKVESRVLNTETILYKNHSIAYNSHDPEWSRETRNIQHIHSGKLTNWIIIFPSRDEHISIRLLDTLMKTCQSFGMRVEYPNIVQINDDRTDSYIKGLEDSVQSDIDLVLCILPNSRKDRYDALKKYFCLEKGILSQMITLKTISRQNQFISVTVKLGIQMNAKIGGEIWQVHIPTKTLMVIGIDMYRVLNKTEVSVFFEEKLNYYFRIDNKGRQSLIGAFIASTNQTLTKYYSRLISRTNTNQMLNDLTPCMQDALSEYQKNNGGLPEKIIIYRDGVSDGHLSAVIEQELPQITSAFSKFQSDYRPKLAMVVVKKRGNTRFFMQDGQHMANPLPGTIIDNTVTKADSYDFYMISQCARQGTVTPTHYNVVWDQTTFKVDQMQRLAFKLCHLYYNWPGTIRVPAVCQYAHKLASLIGQHLHQDFNRNLSNKLFYL